MLRIDIAKRVEKFQARLPAKHRRQIAARIIDLANDPNAQDTKALQGADFRRADSGEYRIAYRIAHRVTGQALQIVLVGKRNDDEVYRQLKRLGR